MVQVCLSHAFSQSVCSPQDQQEATINSDQSHGLCFNDKLRLLSGGTHLHVITHVVLWLVRLSSQCLACRTSIATLLVYCIAQFAQAWETSVKRESAKHPSLA